MARSPVTWAEFVEGGLLRSYRRDLGVRMTELREFVDLLRNTFDVPYPLADRRPYVSGRALVYEAQERSGLDPEFWIVSDVAGQLLLLRPGDEFYPEPVVRKTFADALPRLAKDPHGRKVTTPLTRSASDQGADIKWKEIAEMYGELARTTDDEVLAELANELAAPRS